MNLLALLQTAPKQQGGGMSLLLMMLAIFVVMYFLMIRPQQKKQKELVKFRNQLKKGDKIVTIGGIYGTVDEIEERTLLVEVDKNVKIRVDKSSIVKDISDAQQR
ncbi:MAG: preprotein translocase subunit YajC [Candidatus Egerieousia sp.]